MPRRFAVTAPVLSALLALAPTAATVATAGAGELERVKYRHPGLVVDLAVGLWAWPLPMDFDQDGDLDLVVSCPDVPYGGTYFFENPGGGAKWPVFEPGVRIGSGLRNITLSRAGERGWPRVLLPGEELTRLGARDFATRRAIYPRAKIPRGHGRARADQWSLVDFDGDGDEDLVCGNTAGEIGFIENLGPAVESSGSGESSTSSGPRGSLGPRWAAPRRLEADGKPIRLMAGENGSIQGPAERKWGYTTLSVADWDGDGRRDLLVNSRSVDLLRNVTAIHGSGAAGKVLLRNEGPLSSRGLAGHTTSPTTVDFDGDGRRELLLGAEDGHLYHMREPQAERARAAPPEAAGERAAPRR